MFGNASGTKQAYVAVDEEDMVVLAVEKQTSSTADGCEAVDAIAERDVSGVFAMEAAGRIQKEMTGTGDVPSAFAVEAAGKIRKEMTGLGIFLQRLRRKPPGESGSRWREWLRLSAAGREIRG